MSSGKIFLMQDLGNFLLAEAVLVEVELEKGGDLAAVEVNNPPDRGVVRRIFLERDPWELDQAEPALAEEGLEVLKAIQTKKFRPWLAHRAIGEGDSQPA